jgi:transposase
MIPRNARRGVDASHKLGRYRWVVERSIAKFSRFRRLIIRYERSADLYLAFLTLATAIICFRTLYPVLC